MINTVLLLLATSHTGRAQPDSQVLATHTINLSHLSPIITYGSMNPTDALGSGWNTSLDRHETSDSDSWMRYSFFGKPMYHHESRVGAQGSDRATGNDWRDYLVKTSESDGSPRYMRSVTISTDVPATNGQVHSVKRVSYAIIDDIG